VYITRADSNALSQYYAHFEEPLINYGGRAKARPEGFGCVYRISISATRPKRVLLSLGPF